MVTQYLYYFNTPSLESIFILGGDGREKEGRGWEGEGGGEGREQEGNGREREGERGWYGEAKSLKKKV